MGPKVFTCDEFLDFITRNEKAAGRTSIRAERERITTESATGSIGSAEPSGQGSDLEACMPAVPKIQAKRAGPKRAGPKRAGPMVRVRVGPGPWRLNFMKVFMVLSEVQR